MKATRQLEQYLADFSQRLRKLTLLKGLAASAIVLLIVSVIGAWFARESGQAPTVVNSFRVLLLVALGGVILRAIYQPLKRLPGRLARKVERRSPGFQGRIQTWHDMRAEANPMAE